MNKWLGAILVVVVLFVIASLFSGFFLDSNSVSSDSIVVVPLHGVITIDGGESNLFSATSEISSTKIVKKIQELNDDDLVKGVIFEIDSPGGAVVPSKEIGDAIKKLNKPNYAVIRGVGASGGYWIASSTDKIFANEMSITGSIGVIGSYLEFSELFDKYGINYERFVSGDLKDLGSPYRELNDYERMVFQGKIDKIHEYFVKEVAENRGISVEEVDRLATGEIYLGVEAKELGLIDEFGDDEKAVDIMKKELNNDNLDVVYLENQVGLLELLGSVGAYHFGRGFAHELSQVEIKNSYQITA